MMGFDALIAAIALSGLLAVVAIGGHDWLMRRKRRTP